MKTDLAKVAESILTAGIKTENKTMHTPQELHLRSALENEGYTKDRIEEIVIRDNAHEELVEAVKQQLKQYEEGTPNSGPAFFMLQKALAKAGVKV